MLEGAKAALPLCKVAEVLLAPSSLDGAHIIWPLFTSLFLKGIGRATKRFHTGPTERRRRCQHINSTAAHRCSGASRRIARTHDGVELNQHHHTVGPVLLPTFSDISFHILPFTRIFLNQRYIRALCSLPGFGSSSTPFLNRAFTAFTKLR